MAKQVNFKDLEFILKEDREDETPMTFLYREPNFGMQRINLPKQKFKLKQLKEMQAQKKKAKKGGEGVGDDVEVDVDFYAQQIDTLTHCLRGVKNLTDDEGKKVSVPENVEDRIKLIEALPSSWMMELFHWIATGEDLVDDDDDDDDDEETDAVGEVKNAQAS